MIVPGGVCFLQVVSRGGMVLDEIDTCISMGEWDYLVSGHVFCALVLWAAIYSGSLPALRHQINTCLCGFWGWMGIFVGVNFGL